MAASLVPCPSCARHVRSSERACPFCRSALSTDLAARAVPGTTQRLSRAAAFTFAASLAATGGVAVRSAEGLAELRAGMLEGVGALAPQVPAVAR